MTQREFNSKKPLNRGYARCSAFQVDAALYAALSASGTQHVVRQLTVPARDGLAWEVRAGQTCRIITAHGSQVGDVNFWNLQDPSEHFYQGKTRQFHRTHLTTGDRLWSSHPHLRPMATITQDSLAEYGIDADGMSVHDVIGTRCDPYTQRLMTGALGERRCHQNLTKAIQPWGLQESNVHDVFNIFMCSGFNSDHEYMIKGSPAEAGDYIEWLAEMDLLVALSACPHGDVSVAVSGEETPADKCFPLEVVIGQPTEELLQTWKHTKN